jgi:hypothetical protein
MFWNRIPGRKSVPPLVKSFRVDVLSLAVGGDAQAAAPVGRKVALNLIPRSKSHMAPPLRINIVNEKPTRKMGSQNAYKISWHDTAR